MKKTKKIEIELPFEGFYESIHSEKIDDVILQSFEDDEGNLNEKASDAYSFCDIDFKEIYKDYCSQYVRAFGKYFDLDLKFTDVTSPREYNFYSDSVYSTVPLQQIDRIRKIVESYSDYKDIISDRFTSRDGFISHFSNDINNNEWTRKELAPVQYKIILEVYIEREYPHFNEWELLDDIDIYSSKAVMDSQDKIHKYIKEH